MRLIDIKNQFGYRNMIFETTGVGFLPFKNYKSTFMYMVRSWILIIFFVGVYKCKNVQLSLFPNHGVYEKKVIV